MLTVDLRLTNFSTYTRFFLASVLRSTPNHTPDTSLKYRCLIRKNVRVRPAVRSRLLMEVCICSQQIANMDVNWRALGAGQHELLGPARNSLKYGQGVVYMRAKMGLRHHVQRGVEDPVTSNCGRRIGACHQSCAGFTGSGHNLLVRRSLRGLDRRRSREMLARLVQFFRKYLFCAVVILPCCTSNCWPWENDIICLCLAVLAVWDI